MHHHVVPFFSEKSELTLVPSVNNDASDVRITMVFIKSPYRSKSTAACLVRGRKESTTPSTLADPKELVPFVITRSMHIDPNQIDKAVLVWLWRVWNGLFLTLRNASPESARVTHTHRL